MGYYGKWITTNQTKFKQNWNANQKTNLLFNPHHDFFLFRDPSFVGILPQYPTAHIF